MLDAWEGALCLVGSSLCRTLQCWGLCSMFGVFLCVNKVLEANNSPAPGALALHRLKLVFPS